MVEMRREVIRAVEIMGDMGDMEDTEGAGAVIAVGVGMEGGEEEMVEAVVEVEAHIDFHGRELEVMGRRCV